MSLGWQIFSRHRWLLLSGILILVAAGLIQELALGNGGFSFYPGAEPDTVPRRSGFASMVDLLLSLFLWPLAYTGYQYLALRAVRGEVASLRDMLVPFRQPLSVLGAHWLSVIVTVIGLFLLVIPGIAWGLKFMFSPLVAADKGRPTLGAMGESEALTLGHRWALLGLAAVFLSPYFALGALGYLTLIGELLHWGWWLLVAYGVELVIRPWLTASFAAAYHDLDQASRPAHSLFPGTEA